MVTFLTEGPACSCGLRPRGVEVAQVRVNKRSLRTVGLSLGGMPRFCDECGFPSGHYLRSVRHWLHPDDAEKVAACRARKWPVPA